MEAGLSAYSKREIGLVAKALSNMGDEAIDEARKLASSLSEYALQEIRQAGYQRTKSAGAVKAVVDGATISKSSKTGRISIGFARQRLSGGASTQQLWGGLEFGAPANKYPQFPRWSGQYGKGSRGWFIYPTLRKIQPELTNKWEQAVNQIIKKWAK